MKLLARLVLKAIDYILDTFYKKEEVEEFERVLKEGK